MRRPARNQLALAKLSKAVRKLTTQSFGYKQLARHQFLHGIDPVHPTGTYSIYDLCAEQPICWCHQAITERANIYQVRYDSQVTPNTWNEQVVGTWAAQPFYPVLTGGPTLSEYDSQLFWKNSAGPNGVKVEPTFLLGGVTYTINLAALGVAGNVELCMVYEKNTVSETQNTALPSGLRSFVNSTALSENENVVSARFWKVKRLAKHYFSTFTIAGTAAGAPATPHIKGALTSSTYSQKRWHIKVKSNNVIRISDTDAVGQVIQFREIPLKQRSFLMIRTSVGERDISTAPNGDHVPPGSMPEQRIRCSMYRTVCWRDATGASN